jgi:hypothetical protein
VCGNAVQPSQFSIADVREDLFLLERDERIVNSLLLSIATTRARPVVLAWRRFQHQTDLELLSITDARGSLLKLH